MNNNNQIIENTDIDVFNDTACEFFKKASLLNGLEKFQFLDHLFQNPRISYPEIAQIPNEQLTLFSRIKPIVTDRPRSLWSAHSRAAANCLKGVHTKNFISSFSGGLKIHQLYNMGTILEFDTLVIGCDIVPGMSKYNCIWPAPRGFFTGLSKRLDLFCVSHFYDYNPFHSGQRWEHVDHFSIELIKKLLQARTIPVFIPAGLKEPLVRDYPWLRQQHNMRNLIFTGHKESRILRDYKITSYRGRHVYQDSSDYTPHNIYEIISPNGLKVIFLGDHDYTGPDDIPFTSDIDVLILHYGGVSPHFDDNNPVNSDDMGALLKGIERFNPGMVLLSHIGELGHAPGGGRESWARAYQHAQEASRITGCTVKVLFWGESVYYK